ncbi:MAG: retron system putative HNH endonuclease [Saprospiraceae bacterium]
MKHIVKNPEPPTFIAWKEHHRYAIEQKSQEVTNMDVVWEMLPSKPPRPETEVEDATPYSKDELRRALLEEQGYLCCYCTRSISDSHTTKLDHFLPKEKSKYPHLVFSYENLLACCDGGERDTDKPRELYCDAKKGKSDPTKPIQVVSPFQSDCEAFFEFDELGKIHAKDGDEGASKTIQFFGLDARALNTLRSAAIEVYILEILSDDMDTSAAIAALRQKVAGKFEPFCTAIISVLRHYP